MESKAGNTVTGWGRSGRGGIRGQYWNLRSEKTIVVSTLVCPIHLFRGTSSMHSKHTHKHMCMEAHADKHTHTQHQSLLSQAIQYKDTQSSGNNLILARDVIGFDRRAEPHSPGCSPSVTNKTEGLEDETELNLGELKMRAKTRHGKKQYWVDPKQAFNKSY